MGIRIIQIGKNPKAKKTRKRKITRVRKNPTKKRKKTWLIYDDRGRYFGKNLFQDNAKGMARQIGGTVKFGYPPKTINTKRNPSKRKKHETMIVGLIGSGRKYKRMYFTGKGFSRSKDDAKIFPGSIGKSEAKRILPMLPSKVAQIYVERV